MAEDEITEHTRICSLHFPNGDSRQLSSLVLVASPKKKGTARTQRAEKRSQLSFSPPSHAPVKCKALTSSEVSTTAAPSELSEDTLLSVSIGEPLLSDYSIQELPGGSESSNDIVVNSALLARIEALEAENKKLQNQLQSAKPAHFRLENILGDDDTLRGFTQASNHWKCSSLFLSSLVLLLHYWGTSTTRTSRKRRHKLDPKNQFFLMLIRLRLNARVKDLAYRFGISTALVSKYITTWICFLYQHLREIEWMPTPEQVAANVPSIFVEKYPSTASEVFIETPSDLHMQASTWSSYKHHNTAKFLVACSPNGTITYISPLHVGGISDVELTRVSGFIQKLPRNATSPISIMADRGFTKRSWSNTEHSPILIRPQAAFS